MKLMNFRRLDPLYIHSGKKGLTRGNKDESEVWDFFSSNAAQLAQVCNAIRKGSSRDDILELEDEEACDAPEGRILTRLHRYRERNKELVRKAKQAALKKHGRLACEACGFDFSAVYGPRGEGLIDAHHTKPLHTVADDHRSNIEDLALLCANCHRIVHARREWLTMQELRKLVRTNM
ncbi:HNH endonuclease [Achromobacter aegrifaciens]|uniref:HNH endonuclease n=1 Tax=Achromobacter aegrifaciens TaxID=1287736 RepID=UPI001C2E8391|nr:HNH endonuclease [Achromobacter aegrifaciens]